MITLLSAVDRYEVIDQLGRSDVEALYVARDPLFDRLVVIRLLDERDAGDAWRPRIARAAESAARLRHPNIARIFDVGEHDGQPFIATEYIAGESLADMIRRHLSLPLTRRLRLVEALCNGLGHAHGVAVNHSDLKPSNIRISVDNVLKIVNFTLASSENGQITRPAAMAGMCNYLSPEQIAGQRVDCRSDIYSLGAVFYELLSYRQPFPGTIQDGVLPRILARQPDPIDVLCPGLDSEIAQIIRRALEKNVHNRYQDVQTIGRDVAAIRRRLESEEASLLDIAPLTSLAAAPPADAGQRLDAAIEAPSATEIEIESPDDPPHPDRILAISPVALEEFAEQARARRQALEASTATAVETAETRLDDRIDAGLDRQPILPSPERRVAEALDSASHEIETGDLDGANEHVDAAMRIDPDSARARQLSEQIDLMILERSCPTRMLSNERDHEGADRGRLRAWSDSLRTAAASGRRNIRARHVAAAAALIVALGIGLWWARRNPAPQSGTTTRQGPITPRGAPSPVAPTSGAGTPQTAVAAEGTLIIDALPWAEIAGVVDGAGQPRLSTPAYTPLAIDLPPGPYTVTLSYPGDTGSRSIRVAIEPARTGRAFAEFRRIDVDEYFKRAGW